MKKFLFVFCFIIFMTFSISKAETPDVYCNSAILIDAKTGEVLFEKNSNQKSYPASTTKVLTAYIALSQGYSMNEEIIPSRNAVMSVPSGSSIAYFSENEKNSQKPIDTNTSACYNHKHKPELKFVFI